MLLDFEVEVIIGPHHCCLCGTANMLIVAVTLRLSCSSEFPILTIAFQSFRLDKAEFSSFMNLCASRTAGLRIRTAGVLIDPVILTRGYPFLDQERLFLYAISETSSDDDMEILYGD